jgi:hypothetical protein
MDEEKGTEPRQKNTKIVLQVFVLLELQRPKNQAK